MFLFIIAERGSFMDEKLKRIEAELKKLGINTVDDLNKANIGVQGVQTR